MEDIFPLPFPEVNAGLIEDGKGFITFFGNTPTLFLCYIERKDRKPIRYFVYLPFL